MEDEKYYQMIDWIDEHMDELQLLLVSGLPGYLVTYYKGKSQMLQDIRIMISYVREGTIVQAETPKEG